MSLAKHGAQEADLEQWAEEAFAIKRLVDNNPRALTAAAIAEIYRNAL